MGLINTNEEPRIQIDNPCWEPELSEDQYEDEQFLEFRQAYEEGKHHGREEGRREAWERFCPKCVYRTEIKQGACPWEVACRIVITEHHATPVSFERCPILNSEVEP